MKTNDEISPEAERARNRVAAADARVVVVRLNGGAQQPAHAYAVAAHYGGLLLPVLVLKGCVKCFTVKRPQLEHVAYLNATLRLKGGTTTDTGMSRLRRCDVCHDVGLKVTRCVDVS